MLLESTILRAACVLACFTECHESYVANFIDLCDFEAKRGHQIISEPYMGIARVFAKVFHRHSKEGV